MPSSFKQFETTLLRKGFEAEFNPVNNHLVTIEIIGIPKSMQGKGCGSKIMNQLCSMADKFGVMLQLRPAASSTHSRSKLINFYSKFGFIENKGSNKNPTCQYEHGMYRLPKKVMVEGKVLKASSSYLYHVTNISNLEPIERYGLLPQFGETVKLAYGDSYDFGNTGEDEGQQKLNFEGILFFADTPQLGYSNHGKEFKFNEVLVCVVKKNTSIFKKISDWPEFTDCKNQKVDIINYTQVDNLPIFIESGDWFSFVEQSPIALLYGKELHQFLESNNITSRFTQNLIPPKKIIESLLLEKKSTYKYGCVMLDTSNEPIKKLQTKIDTDDLYEEKDNDKFGLEKESHLTLLYGLEKEVTLDSVKEILDSFDFPKEIEVSKISLFDTDDRYDVLKCDVSLPILNRINKKLRTLPYKNDYPDYNAHLTIAYLKKGMGKKYVDMFKSESFKLTTENCLFSHDGEKDKIKAKKELKEAAGHIDSKIKPELESIENKYTQEGCDLILIYKSSTSSIFLSKIFIKKEGRNKGLGSKAIKDIIQLADKYQLIVALTPSDGWGSNLNRLRKFYKNFGFKDNKGRNKDFRITGSLIRIPIKGI